MNYKSFYKKKQINIFILYKKLICSEKYVFNNGRLLIYAITEFEKIKNNLLLIDKNGNYINNNEKNNYIIPEFDIKEDNENMRIINSYEQVNR